MNSKNHKSPDFINQKYLELLEKSNVHLHKENKVFSLKNTLVFSGIFLFIVLASGLSLFDFTTDNFKDNLLATSFNEEQIIIKTQKGAFYKITKNTNQKWFAKNGMFITVNDKKIIFTDTEDKSHKMNDIYNLWIPKNKHYELVLADGSEINLNENTQIRFNNNRASQVPQVSLLKGEAFFNISHKNDETFRITASDMNVEVYGTSFNLKNDNKEEYTTVALVDGSIKVSNLQDESTFIKPGEQATLYNNTHKLIIENAKLTEALIWTSKQFHFTDEALESILKKLSIWHKKEFVLKNTSLNEIRFTGSLNKEEGLLPFLHVLEYTENIKYSIKENTITLMKNNQIK